MVDAKNIREIILALANKSEDSFYPADVARKIDHKNWRGLLLHVKLVASVLVTEGKIILVEQKGALKYRKLGS
jgi:23S rRNA maturation-related 3'-5' exoribonuclease YhaM